MATITWTDQPNGVNLGVMREAFNTFNTSVKNQVNQNTADTAALDTRVGTVETSVTDIDARSLQNETDITALEASDVVLGDRLTELENDHTLLLNGTSTAASQQPTALDTPIKVEYGAAQVVPEVGLSVAGDLTFYEAGSYQININAHYGRTGGVGVAYLLFRLLLNGVQAGATLASKIDDAETLIPWSNTFIIEAQANDVLSTELMRDSVGNNSGGIFSLSPVASGWNSAAGITMQVYKV